MREGGPVRENPPPDMGRVFFSCQSKKAKGSKGASLKSGVGRDGGDQRLHEADLMAQTTAHEMGSSPEE